jgi:predicted acyl esterase
LVPFCGTRDQEAVSHIHTVVKAEKCLVQDARTVDESHMTKLYAGSPTLFERQAQDHGATGDKYVFEYLTLPMKDGVRLATAICRPRAQGRHPAVMERTPYKTNLRFDHDSELLRARAPDPHRDRRIEFPPCRSQLEHWRR